VSQRTIGSIAALCAALMLGACSEKAQTISDKRRPDTPAWKGAPDSLSVADGWKAGDEASWDQQMRHRAQSQNEYVRIGSQ
jgi:outer membrane biogenesis lipoprotein LolB